MHGLMSYRCFRRARSLRNDRTLVRARSLRSYRAEWAFGRYVAIELWLELGRYVATERGTRLVAAKLFFSSSCPMIRVSSAKSVERYVMRNQLSCGLKEVKEVSLKLCESLLFSNFFQRDCMYVLLEDKQKESIYYFYKIRSDLGESDDFGTFWRYLEEASELTIELTIG
ncbi:hypothetical protein F2Q69_00054003 [Brassica cretica]|uniref:Uncharacterized protein n=1 Tax=Brassica cretica TaxID=69181 RepID=A0A8S9MUF9_BRACR|nr:hypothetical protein F2Q69_00054003 [Brassica cretica]